uniref:Formin-like protein 16 n=1 Tax=Phascolarctos cinereus TaxID=38626 RepID=A0A6P5INM6_PHACI|nr:formin-like protein 16 [Phascolarctos cinereus]
MGAPQQAAGGEQLAIERAPALMQALRQPSPARSLQPAASAKISPSKTALQVQLQESFAFRRLRSAGRARILESSPRPLQSPTGSPCAPGAAESICPVGPYGRQTGRPLQGVGLPCAQLQPAPVRPEGFWPPPPSPPPQHPPPQLRLSPPPPEVVPGSGSGRRFSGFWFDPSEAFPAHACPCPPWRAWLPRARRCRPPGLDHFPSGPPALSEAQSLAHPLLTSSRPNTEDSVALFQKEHTQKMGLIRWPLTASFLCHVTSSPGIVEWKFGVARIGSECKLFENREPEILPSELGRGGASQDPEEVPSISSDPDLPGLKDAITYNVLLCNPASL